MGNKLLPTTLSHYPIFFKSRMQNPLNPKAVSLTFSLGVGIILLCELKQKNFPCYVPLTRFRYFSLQKEPIGLTSGKK